MNKINVKSWCCLLVLCCLVCACGNKGPLVKPDEQAAEAKPEAEQ